jgi:murein DD-endopeptidase MepM/ murein hydrolase activator NlpD
MVHPSQRQPRYSPRTPPWTLTLRRGDGRRSIQLRPWIVGCVVGCVALLTLSYVGATAYLIFRDDILGASVSRQVQMQYAYEERIAALRAELDRLSSRHAVQTETVEQQVATLLQQQATLEERQSSLDALLGEARAAGISVDGNTSPMPRARPDAAENDDVPLDVVPGEPTDDDRLSDIRGARADERQIALAGVRPTLARVASSLDRAESRQSAALDALTTAAGGEEDRLTEALTAVDAKIAAPQDADSEPQGGPFIPVEGLHFVERAALLKKTLDGIEELRRGAAALPVRVPVKAQYLSSRFGYRLDPFLKRPAFHAGLDFVASAGSTVHATAAGTVVFAGVNGGYGEMVEIAHADGVSTRYCHLARALVSKGARVDAGTPIGLVGSTGRSTGPHLHYETRRGGEAIDPALYLAAGKALRGGG